MGSISIAQRQECIFLDFEDSFAFESASLERNVAQRVLLEVASALWNQDQSDIIKASICIILNRLGR